MGRVDRSRESRGTPERWIRTRLVGSTRWGALEREREKRAAERQPATLAATSAGTGTGRPAGQPVRSSSEKASMSSADEHVDHRVRSASVVEKAMARLRTIGSTTRRE